MDEGGRIEGVVQAQSSSKILLCDNLTKLKMGAKRGRPTKKTQWKKNPFDFGLSKGNISNIMAKKGSLKVISCGQNLSKELLVPLQTREGKPDDNNLKEARLVVESAE